VETAGIFSAMFLYRHDVLLQRFLYIKKGFLTKKMCVPAFLVKMSDSDGEPKTGEIGKRLLAKQVECTAQHTSPARVRQTDGPAGLGGRGPARCLRKCLLENQNSATWSYFPSI